MKRDEDIRILCFGDSNTWGYISGTDHNRYLKNERWTGVLSNLLGSKYVVIEEGLNSRTLVSNDERPGREGRNGASYLIPCLDTHDPLDIVIIMLGTNELKAIYDKTSEDIGILLEEYFVKVILQHKSQFSDNIPKLFLVVPPLVNENTDYCKNKYEGAYEKSQLLNDVYKRIADKYNCIFVNNKDLEVGIDGVHMTKKGHNILAKKIVEEIIKF